MGTGNRENDCSNGKNYGLATISPNPSNGKLTSKNPAKCPTNVNAAEKPESGPVTAKQLQLNICCWNIRRGLAKREIEIVNLLESQKIDVLFLVETDTNIITEENDFKIKGYSTVFPTKKEDDCKTRRICLVSEKLLKIKIRYDLMDPTFPTIWLGH